MSEEIKEPPMKKRKVSLSEFTESIKAMDPEEVEALLKQINTHRESKKSNKKVKKPCKPDPYSFVGSTEPPPFLPSHSRAKWPRNNDASNASNEEMKQIEDHQRCLISMHLETNNLPQTIVDNEWFKRRTFEREVHRFEKHLKTGALRRMVEKQPLTEFIDKLKISKDRNKSKKWDNLLRDALKCDGFINVIDTKVALLREEVITYVVDTIQVCVLNQETDSIEAKLVGNVVVSPTMYEYYQDMLNRISICKAAILRVKSDLCECDLNSISLNNGKTIDTRMQAQKVRNKKITKKRKDKKRRLKEAQLTDIQ
eukprot:150616_1